MSSAASALRVLSYLALVGGLFTAIIVSDTDVTQAIILGVAVLFGSVVGLVLAGMADDVAAIRRVWDRQPDKAAER